MADKEVTINHDGIGFFGALTVALVVLKLTGYISWSWLLVFAPLFAPLAMLVGVAALCVAGAAFIGLLYKLGEWYEVRKIASMDNSLTKK